MTDTEGTLNDSEGDMTDGTDKISKLEYLVKDYRDELREKRTKTLGGRIRRCRQSANPSTEEKLWESLQSKLLNDRLAIDHERRTKKSEQEDVESLTRVTPFLVLLLPAILIIVALMPAIETVLKFKLLAIAAALLALVAALVGLWAHRGSVVLDSWGKMLMLSSALLAFSAAVALLSLEALA